MKKLVYIFSFLVTLLILLLFSKIVKKSEGYTALKFKPPFNFEGHSFSIENFKKGIQFVTTKDQPHQRKKFVTFINETYISKCSKCTPLIWDENLIFFRWGPEPNISQKTQVFLAHFDVVPASERLDDWEHPPFEAKMDIENIWGRGALDNKSNLFSLMESLLISEYKGLFPKYSIYFIFGGDEETGGKLGAKRAANYFREKKIAIDTVFDEGLAVTNGIIPGLKNPAGLIGIAEKGYLTIKFKGSGPGGHSSMPPKNTLIDKMSSFVAELNNYKFQTRFSGVAKTFFISIAPHMSLLHRLLFGNLWLFEPILTNQLSQKPSTDAMIHTTKAATVFNSGYTENVLPKSAEVIYNFRIHPGDTLSGIKNEVMKISKKYNLNSEILMQARPTPPSSIYSREFKVLKNVISKYFETNIIAPSLVLGLTDSRYFNGLAKNIYRFSPYELKTEDLERIHGVNERIEIDGFKRMILFYFQLLQDLQPHD